MLVAVAVVLPGCAKNKPQPVVMQASPQVGKHGQGPGASEEIEFDEGGEYGGPPVVRQDLPLAGTKWAWEGSLGTDNFETLDDPSRYSLQFKPNGWFDFRADCKRGSGMYEAKEGGRIALAVINAGHRDCRGDSKAGDFIEALGKAKIFRQAEDKLYFELKAQAKTMVFGLRP